MLSDEIHDFPEMAETIQEKRAMRELIKKEIANRGLKGHNGGIEYKELKPEIVIPKRNVGYKVPYNPHSDGKVSKQIIEEDPL